MSKQKFIIILTGLIIVFGGLIVGALFNYRDDFTKNPVPTASSQFDMYTNNEEYDPKVDSVRFDAQHRRMEKEWQRIVERCRDNEERAREYQDYNYYY